MVEKQVFTIDFSRFPLNQLKALTSYYKYVIRLDTGIKVAPSYAYNQSKNYVLGDGTGKQLRGKGWAGESVFIDFVNTDSEFSWRDKVYHLYLKMNLFSGIWLNMN